MSAAQAIQGATTNGVAALLAPVPEDANAGVMFKVRDTTATAGAKTHIMLNAKGGKVPFTFPNDYDLIQVPYHYALQFARIAEFQVYDQNMRLIRAVATEQVNGVRLERDEVIAKLEELTKEALYNRAIKAGGNFKSGASKQEFMDFLLAMAGMALVSGDDIPPAAQAPAPAAPAKPHGGDGALEAVRNAPPGSIAANEVEFSL